MVTFNQVQAIIVMKRPFADGPRQGNGRFASRPDGRTNHRQPRSLRSDQIAAAV